MIFSVKNEISIIYTFFVCLTFMDNFGLIKHQMYNLRKKIREKTNCAFVITKIELCELLTNCAPGYPYVYYEVDAQLEFGDTKRACIFRVNASFV